MRCVWRYHRYRHALARSGIRARIGWVAAGASEAFGSHLAQNSASELVTWPEAEWLRRVGDDCAQSSEVHGLYGK